LGLAGVAAWGSVASFEDKMIFQYLAEAIFAIWTVAFFYFILSGGMDKIFMTKEIRRNKRL
jgi:hypothetical protein